MGFNSQGGRRTEDAIAQWNNAMREERGEPPSSAAELPFAVSIIDLAVRLMRQNNVLKDPLSLLLKVIVRNAALYRKTKTPPHPPQI